MLRIAHRGASGHATENTLSAVKKALELKSDVIELDVRTTKTGEVVVIHDAYVDRLSNGQGRVKKLTLENLFGLKLRKGEKITTLKKAIRLIDRKAKVNIDIKERDAVEPVVKIVEDFVNNQGWKYSDFYLSAFWIYILAKARQLNKQIPLAPNITFLPRIFLSRANKYKVEVLKFSKRAIRKHQIEKAHKRGQKVWVWTVNNPKEIEKLADWGVDGIVTDYPERI